MDGTHENDDYKLTSENLSHTELEEKIDLYSKGDQDQFFSIQKIKKRYNEHRTERHNKWSKSDLFFAQGIRTGLPHVSHDQIQFDREVEEQGIRNDVLKEAKGKYRLYQNLSKRFNIGKLDSISQSKEIDEPESIQNIKTLKERFETMDPVRTTRSRNIDRER